MCQLPNWHSDHPARQFFPYNKKVVKQTTQMKLQSTNSSSIVDYYPVKFVDGTLLTDWFLRIVSFKGSDATSSKFLRKKDMFDEVNDRVAYGYEVIDFNLIPKIGNPIAGAC